MLRRSLTVIVLTLLLIFSTLYFLVELNSLEGRIAFHETTNKSSTANDPIHIVTVACTNPEKSGDIEEEALTLIKSILISAIVHGVTKPLVFHIFVGSPNTTASIESQVTPFKNPLSSFHKIHFRLEFYSVFDNIVPPAYQKDFISDAKGDPSRPLPCTFIRLFIHRGLPRYVEKVLYLDTDNLVIGNIASVWATHMTPGEQTLGLAQNNEARDRNYREGDIYNFVDLPVVPPKGLNAGVMLMNLTTLRETPWTKSVINAYQEYKDKRIHMNDQRLINALLYYNIRRLKVLPCHYNFQYTHCEKGLVCWDANVDPDGIQIVHGAGDVFQSDWHSFYKIYQAYKNFDLAQRHEHIIDELIKPLRKFHLEDRSMQSCKGRIGHLLFKSLFPK